MLWAIIENLFNEEQSDNNIKQNEDEEEKSGKYLQYRNFNLYIILVSVFY